MKLLVVCRHLPSPTWGAGTRNYYLLRALARAHEVTLLALVDADPADSAAASAHGVDTTAELRSLGCVVREARLPVPGRVGKRLGQTRALLTGQSYLLATHTSAVVQDTLDDLLRDQPPFAAVLFESAILAGVRLPAGLPSIIDQHNIEHELLWRSYAQARGPLRRAYNWLEYRRFKPHELRRCQRAALVLVTSERERDILARLLPGTTIRVVPNGVDLRVFHGTTSAPRVPPVPSAARMPVVAAAAGVAAVPTPAPTARPASPRASPPGGTPASEVPGRVVLSATLDYYPNTQAALHFAHHCWPAILQREPGATWQIVGRNPPPEVRHLARIPGISVTGTVPATQPYLAAAAVAIVPVLTGGGTRLKILEALAMRRAVVSTTIGCEGLAVEPGKHLVVADDPADFARAVVDLLRDPARRAQLGDAGHALVAEHYSWDSAGARLLAAIAALPVARRER